jgi:hypothetical protein
MIAIRKMMMENAEKTNMKTLSQCMTTLARNGFTANFMVVEGKLSIIDEPKKYTPEQVKIDNFYRFEGESDPSDTSILYAIQTHDGTKGIIADAYGVYADTGVSEFMKQVIVITKITKPSNITYE